MGKFTSAGALLATKHDLLLLWVTKGCWKITPRILLSRGSAHALPEITRAGKAAALFSVREGLGPKWWPRPVHSAVRKGNALRSGSSLEGDLVLSVEGCFPHS